MPNQSQNSRELPVETRAAPVERVDEASRIITVVWTTGASVERRDFWTGERYVEELVVSADAIRMQRLNAGAPLLDSHNFYAGVGAQLGVVERAWLEGSRGLADIRFPKADDDAEADKVFRKVRDKIIRSVSVGYKRNKIEVDRKKDPVVYRVVDWEPFEISLVSVPADPEAQVRQQRDALGLHACSFIEQSNAADAAIARMRMAQRSIDLAR